PQPDGGRRTGARTQARGDRELHEDGGRRGENDGRGGGLGHAVLRGDADCRPDARNVTCRDVATGSRPTVDGAVAQRGIMAIRVLLISELIATSNGRTG